MLTEVHEVFMLLLFTLIVYFISLTCFPMAGEKLLHLPNPLLVLFGLTDPSA